MLISLLRDFPNVMFHFSSFTCDFTSRSRKSAPRSRSLTSMIITLLLHFRSKQMHTQFSERFIHSRRLLFSRLSFCTVRDTRPFSTLLELHVRFSSLRHNASIGRSQLAERWSNSRVQLGVANSPPAPLLPLPPPPSHPLAALAVI